MARATEPRRFNVPLREVIRRRRVRSQWECEGSVSAGSYGVTHQNCKHSVHASMRACLSRSADRRIGWAAQGFSLLQLHIA